MPDFTLKQHDTWPPLDAALVDANGPINLTTAASVKLILKTASGSTQIIGTCSIVSAVAGTVRYLWQTSDTASVNTFNAEFEITWNDGKIETVPNSGYFEVAVVADLG